MRWTLGRGGAPWLRGQDPHDPGRADGGRASHARGLGPPAVAAARRDHERSPDDLAEEFVALRADSLALVRGLTPADLGRSGRHPQVGELRVGELLGEWVHHDRNHVRQMLAVTQARVWDQMGNARRFSLDEAE